MQVSLYCYGSGELIQQFLNAVAMVVKPNSGFSHYVGMAFLLAAFIAGIQYTQSRRLSVLVFAILRYTIISSVLLLPTFKVQIVDEVVPGQTYVVDHVPLGLALPASWSSRFFHGLTRLVETAFHMPDDLNYTRSGFLFASSLVQKSMGFSIIDAQDRQNLKNYVEQCVFYDLHHGKYTVNELLTTTDVWGLVAAKPSPIRSFLLNDKVVTCKEGTILLEARWNDILTQSGVKYAKVIFPGLKKQSEEQLKQALFGSLEVSYQHLTDFSQSSSSIMKQLIMVNAIRDGALNNSTLAAWSYAQSKGDFQKFLGSVNTGLLAARWLPILKDVIECMLYGVFIVVVIYALFAGGYQVLVNYVISLAYLGSWPLVYAVLNYGATYVLRMTSSGYTLSLTDLPYINNTNYYLSSIFGYVTLTVPYLAWQLITLGKQGLGSALTQLSQLVGGSTQAISMGTAQELATGSFGLGNLQLDNQSISTMSGFKYDQSLSYSNGAIAMSMPSGAVMSQFQDGHVAINQTPAMSSLNTQIHLANSLRTSAGEQADSAEQAALSDAVNYSKQMDHALRNMLDYGKSVVVSESSGDTHSVTQSAASSESLQGIMQDVTRFAEANNVSIEKARKHLLGAYVNGNLHGGFSSDKTTFGRGLRKFLGASIGMSATVGGKSEWDWVSSNSDSILFTKAEEFVKNENFSKNLESSLRAFSEGAYRTNTEEGKRLADSVSTSYGEAQNMNKSLNAHLQQSQSYREYASYSEENAATIDRNASQDFTEWLSQQPLQPGLGAMGYQQAEVLLSQDPELAECYSRQFVQVTTAQKMAKWRDEHIAGQVDRAYQAYQGEVPQANLQNHYHKASDKLIKSKAEANEVSFGIVDKNKAEETSEVLNRLQNELDMGDSRVAATGDARTTELEAMRQKHGRRTEEEKR